ncbi:MAG: hypothetical protein KGM18_00640 [Sphingomonadales bacterium]|nr:hypothetical protein [Sphingomonadales bacterium]
MPDITDAEGDGDLAFVGTRPVNQMPHVSIADAVATLELENVRFDHLACGKVEANYVHVNCILKRQIAANYSSNNDIGSD